jgi:hypothetical protein
MPHNTAEQPERTIIIALQMGLFFFAYFTHIHCSVIFYNQHRVDKTSVLPLNIDFRRTIFGKSKSQTTAMNSTECLSGKHDNPLCFDTTEYPFYYLPKTQLVDGIPDHLLTLAAPVVAYWALSLFFHFLDTSEWKWLNKYRIHESEEVKSKNLVTKSQVVWAVIFQQVIQTGLGLAALSDDSSHLVNHRLHLLRIASYVEHGLPWLSGNPKVLARITEFIYWWGIPALQFLGAMYVSFNALHSVTDVPKVRH